MNVYLTKIRLNEARLPAAVRENDQRPDTGDGGNRAYG